MEESQAQTIDAVAAVVLYYAYVKLGSNMRAWLGLTTSGAKKETELLF